MTLSGKHILIIGGTSGFGLEIAKQAHALGAKLTLVGRDGDKAARVAGTLPGAKGIGFDATQADALPELFAQTGSFDHLVSMLGGAMGGGFLSADADEIRKTIQGKFFDNLLLARAAAAHLNENGSMTFTAGSGGRPDNASGAFVGNSDIALLVRGLAVELAASKKARANAVAPTWTPTPLWRSMKAEDIAATQAHFNEQIPLGRTGAPEEVAQAYIFLMGCGFITGQTVTVDGGLSIL